MIKESNNLKKKFKEKGKLTKFWTTGPNLGQFFCGVFLEITISK